MWWMHPWHEPEAEPPGPVEFVYIHGHCWMDHNHIVQMKVVKTDQHEPHLFECKKCEVKEKTPPCEEPCDMLVRAETA